MLNRPNNKLFFQNNIHNSIHIPPLRESGAEERTKIIIKKLKLSLSSFGNAGEIMWLGSMHAI